MPNREIVFIVDDDADVRRSWECVLAAAGLRHKSYASAEAFLAEADYQRPCCLILDLRMPGMGGQELLQTLRHRNCSVPVIIVSGHADVPTAIETMKLGLVDFLLKPVDPAHLVAKIREVLREAADLLTQKGAEGLVLARLATLSEREMEVFRLLARGRLHKQIAVELGISTRTVDHHHVHINVKMEIGSTADLVRVAALAGLA